VNPLKTTLLAAATLAACLVTTAPRPAEAQTVIRVCAINQSGIVIRSRFTYRDWQGTSHTSNWETSNLGQRNCHTLQDLQSLAIEVEGWAVSWLKMANCSRRYVVPDPRKTANLFVSGTAFDPRCSLEQ
jgi:hypothetical protein